MFEKDPRTFEADIKGLSPEQKAMVKLEITLTKFFKSFNDSISRWERLIYPTMIVMAILGLSGFYLIYHVTKDMSTMTQSIDPRMAANLAAMSSHMSKLSDNIEKMTGQIGIMVEKIENMDSNIAKITDSIEHVDGTMNTMTEDIGEMKYAIQGMSMNIYQMNVAVRDMNLSTKRMSHDINEISEPMDFMNSFTPW